MARDEVAADFIRQGAANLALGHGADTERDAFKTWWQSFLRGTSLPDCPDNRPLRTIDFFCGAGGLGLGIDLAARTVGHRSQTRCLIDADGAALEVCKRARRAERAIQTSVASLVDYRVRQRGQVAKLAYEPEVLNETLANERGVDLLIAGPPCQGHSNLNNHTRRNDPRNDLFVATAALAIALEARAIVIENVPTVLRSHGEVVRIAKELLSERYDLDEATVRADSLGWPQTRSRYFLIAKLKSDGETLIEGRLKQRLAESRRDPMDVDWAIGDLQGLVAKNVFDTAPNVSAENARRIDWLFDNEAHDLDNAERPVCHQDGTTYTAVYGRLYGDRPAPTITTGIDSPGRGRFIHPHLRRLITPHEAARLQGFPDGYGFVDGDACPSRKSLNKWIGDAVPPIVGMHVGIVVLEHLVQRTAEVPWDKS